MLSHKTCLFALIIVQRIKMMLNGPSKDELPFEIISVLFEFCLNSVLTYVDVRSVNGICHMKPNHTDMQHNYAFLKLSAPLL